MSWNATLNPSTNWQPLGRHAPKTEKNPSWPRFTSPVSSHHNMHPAVMMRNPSDAFVPPIWIIWDVCFRPIRNFRNVALDHLPSHISPAVYDSDDIHDTFPLQLTTILSAMKQYTNDVCIGHHYPSNFSINTLTSTIHENCVSPATPIILVPTFNVSHLSRSPSGRHPELRKTFSIIS